MTAVPPDWLVWGALPVSIEIESPDGLWTAYIDPSGDRYRCRLIAQHDPNHPCVDTEVRDATAVKRWIQETLSRLA
jgi:hypothetical protein